MIFNKIDCIVILLGKQIVSGKYVLGLVFLVEVEFCEEFEILCNIICEVFCFLMVKWLIEMKCYCGVFVVFRNQWNYFDIEVLQWVLENDYDLCFISVMSEVCNLVEFVIVCWVVECVILSDLVEIELVFNDMIVNN